MNKLIYSSIIESDIKNIKPLVKDLLKALISFLPNLPHEDALDLRLILSEALSNAIIHGNHRVKDKKVIIKAEIINAKTIMFQIEDEGEGFNFQSILKNITPEDLYKEDGRGFVLIDSLCDSIEFFKNGKEIHIYKTVHNNA